MDNIDINFVISICNTIQLIYCFQQKAWDCLILAHILTRWVQISAMVPILPLLVPPSDLKIQPSPRVGSVQFL